MRMWRYMCCNIIHIANACNRMGGQLRQFPKIELLRMCKQTNFDAQGLVQKHAHSEFLICQLKEYKDTPEFEPSTF